MINQSDFASRMAELDAKNAEIKKQAAEELKLLQGATDVDIEVRWKMFLRLCPYLRVGTYYSHAIDHFGRGFNLYEDMYMDRHTTRSWEDISDQVEDHLAMETGRWATQENWDKVREAAIAEGYGGFTNDW